MDDQAFEPGEVVSLHSGGPPMTVRFTRPTPDGLEICCEWFDAEIKPRYGCFLATSLQLHVEEL